MKSGKTMEYSAWFPGQPDNIGPYQLTEDCLQLLPSNIDTDRRWNDVHCRNYETAEDLKNKPLCQLF